MEENTQQATVGMTFGEAFAAMQEGKLVAREGWNGKGLFAFMRPADVLDSKVVIENVKSLPEAVKIYYQRRLELGDQYSVKFGSYLCLKSVDGHIANGWIPSQTDMQGTDWSVVDPIEAANGSHAIANPPTK